MQNGTAAQQNPMQQLFPSALLVSPAWQGPQHARVRQGTEPRLSQSPMQPRGPCFHPSLAMASRKLPAGTQRDVQMSDIVGGRGYTYR